MMIHSVVLLAALVRVGDHAIDIACSGRGRPTVVIENGLGESAAEWAAIRARVQAYTRVCTYDRAGYFGSGPGPLPRTFDQINFELKTALEDAKEEGPFVLAGHSFGGAVIRQFAVRYPSLVAGLVLIDAVHENQQTFYGGAYHRLRDGASGRTIPDPQLSGSKKSTKPELDLEETEQSQRDWAPEYFARWFAHPQTGLLGSKPLLVLARNSRDLQGIGADADVARERALLQLSLAALSDDAVITFVGFDHEMQKTIPDVVASNLILVARAVREHRALRAP